MRVPLNDLSRRSSALKDETNEALGRVTARGWYLLGPEVEAFEHEFASHVGASGCVGVASGTDALQIALVGLGCEPGDEIITAANAGGYTTAAALAAQLRPRFADVDADTLCLSAPGVAAALTPRTRAVVVTHLYGRLADVEPIVELCRERAVGVVEDCAQAAGAAHDDRRAGTFGDAAAFSFYPTKNLGALGDAGAVVTSDAEMESRVRRLAQYGWDRKYRVSEAAGRNSRLDELQAAFLRVALPHLDGWNERRRGIAMRYAAALSGAEAELVGVDEPGYVAHLAVLRTEGRDAARAQLEEAEVSTAVHYPIPDHRQPAWREAYPDIVLPVTERSAAEILTVPCFPELRDEEVDQVIEALRSL